MNLSRLIGSLSMCSEFAAVSRNGAAAGNVFGQVRRTLSSSADLPVGKEKLVSETPQEQNVVSKTFVNRNPRNLEMLGIAWKRRGWKFQYPTREYYHRLLFEQTNRHTTAYVEHCSGVRVLSASTTELAIARHLHSMKDVSAAHNVGRVLAQRCLESGLTSMILEPLDNSATSLKLQAFRAAIESGGVSLAEPTEQTPDYEPGIDYSDPTAVADLERRQWLVFNLGEASATLKHLKGMRRVKGRRRRKAMPTKLEQPSYTLQ